MSYLVGSGQEVFGAGGEALAQAIDAPPARQDPARSSAARDAGEPLVWAEPENETARTIIELAEALVATGRRPGGIKKALPVVS
jgi:hypothetical protein